MSDAPKVVSMPLRGLANDNRQLAVELRALADDVETGAWGTVENVVVVLHGSEGLHHRTYGRSCDHVRAVGLLTWAAHRIISPVADDT